MKSCPSYKAIYSLDIEQMLPHRAVKRALLKLRQSQMTRSYMKTTNTTILNWKSQCEYIAAVSSYVDNEV